jgi:hypothetical protein
MHELIAGMDTSGKGQHCQITTRWRASATRFIPVVDVLSYDFCAGHTAMTLRDASSVVATITVDYVGAQRS